MDSFFLVIFIRHYDVTQPALVKPRMRGRYLVTIVTAQPQRSYSHEVSHH